MDGLPHWREFEGMQQVVNPPLIQVRICYYVNGIAENHQNRTKW